MGEDTRVEGDIVRQGNAAYGAGLRHLLEGNAVGARSSFEDAAARWRESWEHATPTSWGRPIGVLKALLLAGDEDGAREAADWALTLGCVDAESPIGRYAAALALSVLERWDDARHQATSLRERDDFPHDVADALSTIAAHDVIGAIEAIESVVASFESRDEYLEDVAVADTALVLQLLARIRGFDVELPTSPVLP